MSQDSSGVFGLSFVTVAAGGAVSGPEAKTEVRHFSARAEYADGSESTVSIRGGAGGGSGSGTGTDGMPAFTGEDTVQVRGAELLDVRIEGGKITDASAERGEEFLIEMLDTDPGARRLGELGIGTNYGITDGTGEILLDEKIGGTVHLALGRSYPETGGKNESALHWDLICDLRRGGSITADGELVVLRSKAVMLATGGFDIPRRLQDMDATGVDVHVLSATPQTYLYGLGDDLSPIVAAIRVEIASAASWRYSVRI